MSVKLTSFQLHTSSLLTQEALKAIYLGLCEPQRLQSEFFFYLYMSAPPNM